MSGIPDLIPPMLVSAGSGQPPSGLDWVVELAWTGHRCIAYVEPGRRTRLMSSGNVSMTAAYPEIGPELERRSPTGGMILDGTLVARGEEHAPRVARLQRRSARYRPSEQHIRAVPVDLQVADLLWLDGHSTVDLAYRDRRALLDRLRFDTAPVWTTSPMPVSELPGMLRIAEAEGVDALHARHLGSRYRPGQRSPLWVRLPVPRTGRVLVGGWTPTDPQRPDRIASLLVGVPEAGGLRYVGRVGVTAEQRKQVTGLRALRQEDSPFTVGLPETVAREAIWVQPRVAALVGFTGFTADGRMRLPLWQGPAGAGSEAVRWARRDEPDDLADPSQTRDEPMRAPPAAATSPASAVPVASVAAPPLAAEDGSGERRRLEQHFVYNALNTIAALIRTDPGRARELLVGFADLTRAADQTGDVSTLGRELEAVRGYLSLEQARFGQRLRTAVRVDTALYGVPVAPLSVLAVVRDAVQHHIEPRPQGGELTVTAEPADGGCTVTVECEAGPSTILTLAAAAPA